MFSFKDVDQDELVKQWNELFPEYISKVKQLAEILQEYNTLRSKLQIIKTELETRNIKVDDTQEG